MKILPLIIILGCSTAHAEWYRVNTVPSYNTIRAAKADGENQPITIRIRNLEKIEYIQPHPEKVLIGGEEAISLAKRVLQGQMVWVENLAPEEGAYVADVYPSFEQVITAYKEKRIANGDNISESTKVKLKVIYKQMLADFNLASLSFDTGSQPQDVTDDARRKLHDIYRGMLADIRSEIPKTKSLGNTDKTVIEKGYEGEYQRAMFTADAILWFNKNGQYLQPSGQKLFVALLLSFQTDASQNARYTMHKIETIMKKELLFKELFMNTSDFEQGKFTYTCLEWFKNRGQYLPDDVQNVFVNWVRIYQQAHSTENGFMKLRLQWMMDNNGLYQDFLELGN